MTEIVIATRDGILTAPESGEKFRLVKGRTLADARHPAVRAYPDNFMPVEIGLSVDDPADDVSRETSVEPDEDLTTELGELREIVESYQSQLSAIAAVLAERDLLPDDGRMSASGWLVHAVTVAIDGVHVSREASPPVLPSDEPVPPPRRAARASRKPASPDVES